MARPLKLRLTGQIAPKDESEVRWLISYSDFMMQLVCLFILLYSVSTLDKGRMALVAAYYRAAKGLGEPPVKEPPSKGKNLAVGERPLVSAPSGRADVPPGLRYALEAIPGGWILRFQEAIFAPGSSELSPEARGVLDSIVPRLQAYAGVVSVTATASASEGDALGLAQSRAEAVVGHLTRSEVDPRFLEASGKESDAGAAGRVEIVLRVK